eukprot:scaffold76744_cov67-Phaeocystis_antarctica.AAC.9
MCSCWRPPVALAASNGSPAPISLPPYLHGAALDKPCSAGLDAGRSLRSNRTSPPCWKVARHYCWLAAAPQWPQSLAREPGTPCSAYRGDGRSLRVRHRCSRVLRMPCTRSCLPRAYLSTVQPVTVGPAHCSRTRTARALR